MFPKLAWGRSTTRGRTLYLHVFDWPGDGLLAVPGLRNAVRSARLLASGAALKAETAAAGVMVRVPPQAPDAVASVLELELDAPPRVQP